MTPYDPPNEPPNEPLREACAPMRHGPARLRCDFLLWASGQGISCYAIDLQGHGESEGARGLRGFFETFDDLAKDLLQLHDLVSEETGGVVPIYWLGCSMGAAVCCRASQIAPRCGLAGMVMLAPMISLDKVAQKSILGPIKNKHIAPIGGLLSFLVPTLPLIAKSNSVLAQQIDEEVGAPASPGDPTPPTQRKRTPEAARAGHSASARATRRGSPRRLRYHLDAAPPTSMRLHPPPALPPLAVPQRRHQLHGVCARARRPSFQHDVQRLHSAVWPQDARVCRMPSDADDPRERRHHDRAGGLRPAVRARVVRAQDPGPDFWPGRPAGCHQNLCQWEGEGWAPEGASGPGSAARPQHVAFDHDGARLREGLTCGRRVDLPRGQPRDGGACTGAVAAAPPLSLAGQATLRRAQRRQGRMRHAQRGCDVRLRCEDDRARPVGVWH